MSVALITREPMEPDPGQVIRSLRLALEMSQAEFARAAGWAPSTISNWERGRAKPSRLAFKTILAFAEERGVRYRPRSPSTALVLATPQRPAESSTSASPAFDPARAARMERAYEGPRPELRPLLYADHLAEAAPRPAGAPPRWSAEASFRLTLGARQATPRARLPRGVAELAIAGIAFCVAFGLRGPLHHWLRTPNVAATAPALPRVPPTGQRPPVTAGSAPIPLLASAVAPADLPQAPPLAPVISARLESVIAIGGAGRATFRTANDAVTVTTGEWLGSRQVADIDSDGVILVDRDGVRRRVHVGQQIAFD